MGGEKKFYLTKKGLEKIKKDYEILRHIRLTKTEGEVPKILESEDINPEYLSFREDLNLLETKITDLENVLKNAEIIRTPPKSKQNIVNLGATVLVDLDGETDEFKIVGTLEANPAERKISNESPIGKALLGRMVGARVKVTASVVNHFCKIKKIKYNKA